jgi:hypothetical protein
VSAAESAGADPGVPEAAALPEAELIRAFEAGRLAGFHHREHVRLAWAYLRERPLLEALPRFVEGLRRFAAAHGVPEKYHATVTWAYLLLIHERMRGAPGMGRFDAFAAANPDLLVWKPSVLERYYRRETLDSERARGTFVLPDAGGTEA